jgi:hypothetical protein
MVLIADEDGFVLLLVLRLENSEQEDTITVADTS